MELKKFVRSLRIIHWAMVLAIILFAVVVWFLIPPVSAGKNTQGLTVLGPVFALLLILVSNMNFQKRIRWITSELTLQEKREKYASAFVMRHALLEGAAFFLIVIAFITHERTFLVVATVLALLMNLFIPTEAKVRRVLWKDEEAQQIRYRGSNEERQ